jgi:Na+/H+ antiporter NhaD/arsenite permease-like protein
MVVDLTVTVFVFFFLGLLVTISGVGERGGLADFCGEVQRTWMQPSVVVVLIMHISCIPVGKVLAG